MQPRVTKKVEDEYENENDDNEGEEVETRGDDADDANDDDDGGGAGDPKADGGKKGTRRYLPVPKEELFARNCTICLHYNGILYMDFLGPEQMVVVEQPWLPIVATFPDALQRRIYGFN